MSTTSRLATLVAAGAALALPGAANATTCTYDPVRMEVDLALTAPAPAGFTTIGRLGPNVVWHDGAPSAPAMACPGATIFNTDLITVVGTAQADRLIIDLSQGPLAPGATAEPGQLPEIEMLVDLVGPRRGDTIEVFGSRGPDIVTAGRDAAGNPQLALNGDPDPDVGIARTPALLTLVGDAGNDELSGQGGFGIANDYDGRMNEQGGPGDDQLLGGRGRDVLFGDTGIDRYDAFQGRDTITSLDGNAEIVATGPGVDTVTADAFDVVS